MICFLSFYRFNYRFEPFYLLTFHIIEHILHLGCFHGGVGIAFSHIYASDISSGKSSFLAQKSQYVALANLVFFALFQDVSPCLIIYNFNFYFLASFDTNLGVYGCLRARSVRHNSNLSPAASPRSLYSAAHFPQGARSPPP